MYFEYDRQTEAEYKPENKMLIMDILLPTIDGLPIVNCDTQEEIDYYWDKLSAFPEAEQCGWLKDRYGFSWQVTPRIMNDIMKDKDAVKLAQVTEAFLKMKKFNIAELMEALVDKTSY